MYKRQEQGRKQRRFEVEKLEKDEGTKGNAKRGWYTMHWKVTAGVKTK